MADDQTDEFTVWPAFVDLLAATSLLFVVFVAVFLLFATRAEVVAAEEREALATTLAQLDTALMAGRDDGLYDLVNDGQFIRITLQADATFDRGQFDWNSLRAEGREALGEIGQVLKDSSVSPLYREARVIGHADATPYPGDQFTNWELSASRAAVVARFLVNEVGVDPCAVSASGVSSYYPADGSRGEDGELSETAQHRRDRRIELEIVPTRHAGGDQVRRANCDRRGDGTGPRDVR